MKKILIGFSLAILSFSSAAKKDDDYNLMNVQLVNIGAENCVLQHVELKAGSLSANHSFPSMLPANGMPSAFQITGPKVKKYDSALVSADVSLTYQCGVYKKFTLDMKQYYKKSHYHGYLDVLMHDAVDVFETHEVIAPERKGYHEPQHVHAGSVHWVISN